MKPVSPVIPGQNYDEIVIAKDQPEYMPLPVIVFQGGVILSRWHMDDAERVAVAATGELYICLLTFGREMPDVKFQVDNPLAAGGEEDLRPKTIYPGNDLPVLYRDGQSVWMSLKLTDEDRNTLARIGDVYFFMETGGRPITPSLVQVERPQLPAVKVEFMVGVRYSETAAARAAKFGIEISRDKCSICHHQVIVSNVSVEAGKKLGAKIICLVCAEDASADLCVLPETVRELQTALEKKKHI